jgi:hypothetical protein
MPYKAEGLVRPTVAASLVDGGFERYGLFATFSDFGLVGGSESAERERERV